MFTDRSDAGKKLADRLQSYKNQHDAIVIGLPRGGVVVAFEVAQKLNLPLDIVAPRKISMPGNPEAAIGAVTPDGNKVLDSRFISEMGITQEYIDSEITKEITEAKRRIKTYRGEKAPLNLKDKTIIIVDDGVATGSTMRAAIKSIRSQSPKKIIAAVPVAPEGFLQAIAPKVEEMICLEIPPYFVGVSQIYEHFPQTSDDEVIKLMKGHRKQ